MNLRDAGARRGAQFENAVDDLDETLARLSDDGAELVSSEVVQYRDAYRLCSIRAPGGLLIGLAEQLA
jgi:hypothetical protein